MRPLCRQITGPFPLLTGHLPQSPPIQQTPCHLFPRKIQVGWFLSPYKHQPFVVYKSILTPINLILQEKKWKFRSFFNKKTKNTPFILCNINKSIYFVNKNHLKINIKGLVLSCFDTKIPHFIHKKTNRSNLNNKLILKYF